MTTSMETLQVLEGIGERLGGRGGGRDEEKLLRRTISEGNFMRGAMGSYSSQKLRKKELTSSDETVTNSKARKGEQMVGTSEDNNKGSGRNMEMEDGTNLENNRANKEQNKVNVNGRWVEKLIEGLPYQPLIGQEGAKGLSRQGSIVSTLKELEMAACDGVVVIIPCHQLPEIMPRETTALQPSQTLTVTEMKEEEEELPCRQSSGVEEGIACDGGREERVPRQPVAMEEEVACEKGVPRGQAEVRRQQGEKEVPRRQAEARRQQVEEGEEEEEVEVVMEACGGANGGKKKAGATAPRQQEAGCDVRIKKGPAATGGRQQQQQQQRSPRQQPRQQQRVPSQQQPRGQGHLQVKVVECECCGLSEECTEAYIEKVRGMYCGRWVCGLCAAAVSEERRRLGRGSPMRDALRAHLDVCARFSSTPPPSDVAVPAALCHVLRRHLSEPASPSPTSTSTSTSSSRTPSSSTSPSAPSLARSSSCLPSFSSSSSSSSSPTTTSDHPAVPILSLPPFPRRPVPRT